MPLYTAGNLSQLPTIPVGESIEIVRDACGRRRPDSLNFGLKPHGGEDAVFADVEQIEKHLAERRLSKNPRTRLSCSRLTAHGRMLDALPVFARSLQDHCAERRLAVSGVFIRFASQADIANPGQSRILSPDIMWHTDLRYTSTYAREILPEAPGSEKIVVTSTISRGEGSFDNGTQYVSDDGAVDTDGSRTVVSIAELTYHEECYPDLVAVDITGRPVYVPDDRIDGQYVRSAPEQTAYRIPQAVVHRTNPEMDADGAVGRVLLSAFLRRIE